MRPHKPHAPAVARDATRADRMTRHRARATGSAPLVASPRAHPFPSHPPSPAPGPWAQGSRRCAWAPCGAHAFCLTRCPASAGGFARLLHEQEGFGLPSNGQWTCGGKFDGPPEFDFCERTPAGTRVKGGWGGGVGGHRDGGSGPEFELSVGEQARGVQLPGERRRRGSRVRWQGPVEA